jgi:hypothetical protein
LVFTVLALFFSHNLAKLGISGSGFKNFSDRDNKEIKDKLLNFTQGDWYIFDANDQNNPDHRIMEFHSKNRGLLNYFTGLKITGQAFLTKFHVLVFYEDKNPVIAFPLAKKTNKKKANLKSVLKEVKKQMVANPNFLDQMNSFPYYTMFYSYYNNTNELIDFPEKLRNSADDDDASKVFEQYDIPPNKYAVNEMIKQISYMIYDMYISQSTKVFYDPNYIGALRGSNSLWEQNHPKFVEMLKAKLEEIKQNKTIMEVFLNLINEIHYFTHKCLRHYFFSNKGNFIKDLFNGYQLNNSKFSELFEKNMKDSKVEEIANVEILKQLEPEINFDYHFIQHDEDDSQLAISQKVYNNFTVRLDRVNRYISQIVDFFDPDLQKIRKIAKPIMQINRKKYVGTMLVMYRSYFFDALYFNYTPIVKKGFLKMQELKNNSIKDLEDPEQFTEFRKRMVILGYLDHDEIIDRPNYFYIKYKRFKTASDRLVLV